MTGRVALPLPHCDRWTAGRKEAVVVAIRRGVLTVEEACDRYGLSYAEVGSWAAGRVFVSWRERDDYGELRVRR
jgi:hypothetical protein